MSHGRQNFVNNCCRITISLWMLILYGWQKILENITCGYGHHLWKYWIYHSWPLATRDKSNIFTRDNHNHSWYFPIFFPSHLLLSQYVNNWRYHHFLWGINKCMQNFTFWSCYRGTVFSKLTKMAVGFFTAEL